MPEVYRQAIIKKTVAMILKKIIPTTSIYSQLLMAFMLLVLTPALTISVTSAWSSYEIGRQRTLDQMDSVATLKSAEIDMWTNELNVSLDMLLSERDRTKTVLPLLLGQLSPADAQQAKDALLENLNLLVPQTDVFSHLCLLDANGRVIVSTDPARTNQDLSSTSYYQQGLQKNFITPPFRASPQDQRLIIVASHPVIAPGRGAVGVLAGYSDISVLDRIMGEPMGLGHTGESYLLGSDYVPLTQLRFQTDPPITQVKSEGARLAVENKIRRSGSYLDYRRNLALGVYTWLPELQVALVVEQDQTEVFRAVTTSLIINLCVSLAAMWLAMLVASIVTRSIARPLSALSTTATQIAAGELEQVAEVNRQDEIGKLAQAFNHMTGRLRDLIKELQAELEERRKAEEHLRESEAWNRTVLQTAMDGFWRVDTQGHVLEVNQAYCQMSGYSEQELLSKYISDLEAVEKHADVIAHAQKVVLQGEDRFETRHIRKDGSVFELEISLQYKPEQGGTLFAFMRDITERKRAEEQIRKSLAEKETLLRELHHRTKNNMSVIIALLDLQAEESDDRRLQAAFADSQNRIRSMALVHQKLYEAQDLSHINLKDYIGDLTKLLVASYQVSSDRISITLEMEDVSVLIDTAIPCGLILNELVSNALKYAFPDERVGEIRIQLHQLESGEVQLSVADDGAGLPPGFDLRRNGRMGLQTVFALAENQLYGKVSFDTRQGVTCQIQFRDNLYKPRV